MVYPAYCTVNVSVTVRTTPSLLAITVIGKVPVDVPPLVLMVKVVEPDPVIEVEPKLEVAPI